MGQRLGAWQGWVYGPVGSNSLKGADTSQMVPSSLLRRLATQKYALGDEDEDQEDEADAAADAKEQGGGSIQVLTRHVFLHTPHVHTVMDHASIQASRIVPLCAYRPKCISLSEATARSSCCHHLVHSYIGQYRESRQPLALMTMIRRGRRMAEGCCHAGALPPG